MNDSWLLPEYIEDVLPPEAWRMERIRRQALELFQRYGYQLVIPPLLEYVDSLLTGTGHDLDLSTFKLVDQLSGRHMGIRADITPQAARIDAHLMNRRGVNRVCYAGTALRTLPEGMARSRELLQIGAEVYGHGGIESDIEIQHLMLQVLRMAGIQEVTVDLGNVQIFRTLAKLAGLNPEIESNLFSSIQRKDMAAVRDLTSPLAPAAAKGLEALLNFSGGAEVLEKASKQYRNEPVILKALAELNLIGQKLSEYGATVTFDLGELRGYHYHSGIVFAAYAKGFSDALARGGRYDEVGKAFGRARPATGFSLDLRELVTGLEPEPPRPAILAPHDNSAELTRLIDRLRESGETVIIDFPAEDGPSDSAELGCDRVIKLQKDRWQVVPRSGNSNRP